MFYCQAISSQNGLEDILKKYGLLLLLLSLSSIALSDAGRYITSGTASANLCISEGSAHYCYIPDGNLEHAFEVESRYHALGSGGGNANTGRYVEAQISSSSESCYFTDNSSLQIKNDGVYSFSTAKINFNVRLSASAMEEDYCNLNMRSSYNENAVSKSVTRNEVWQKIQSQKITVKIKDQIFSSVNGNQSYGGAVAEGSEVEMYVTIVEGDMSQGVAVSTAGGCTYDANSKMLALHAGFAECEIMLSKNANLPKYKAAQFAITVPIMSLDVNKIWASTPLVIAKDNAGKPQPITAAPIVSRTNKIKGGYPNVMVMFGTGRYLYKSDLRSTDAQSIYAVRDVAWQQDVPSVRVDQQTFNDDGSTRNSSGKAIVQLDRDTLAMTGQTIPALVQRHLLVEPTEFGDFRSIQGDTNEAAGERLAESIDWNKQSGWFMDLNGHEYVNGAAERSIYRPLAMGETLIVNTIMPSLELSCNSATLGSILQIDWTTGFAPQFYDKEHDGDDPYMPIYDTDGDGSITSDDTYGVIGKIMQGVSELNHFGKNIIYTEGREIKSERIYYNSDDAKTMRAGWEEKHPAEAILSN